MINCNKNLRIVGPSGTWTIDQLIGSRVLLKSMPISNFFGTPCSTSSGYLTISDIKFQISLDGKTITIIRLEEYPDKFFTWKDIEILEINTKTKVKPICGTFICDQAICGYEVDKSPSYIEEIANSGLIILDEQGNTITNRFLRFIGADVEDPTTDDNMITDITVSGDVLD